MIGVKGQIFFHDCFKKYFLRKLQIILKKVKNLPFIKTEEILKL